MNKILINGYALQLLIAFLLAFLTSIEHSQSSTFALSRTSECKIDMSDAIESGDSNKFLKFLSENQIESGPFTLCIQGPGGSYSELAPLIDKFFELNVSTYLRPNTVCYSACALLFMAGSYSESSGETIRLPSRRMDVTAKLGFHAPYLDAKDLAVPPDKINIVYSLGVQAVASLLKRNEDGIFPTTLIVELLSKGPNEVILVDNIQKAGRWKISLSGYKMPPSIDLSYILQSCYAVSNWVDIISSTAPYSPEDETIGSSDAQAIDKEAAALEVGKSLFITKYNNTTRFRITTGFGGEASYACIVNIYRANRKFRIKAEYASIDQDEGTSAQSFDKSASDSANEQDSFWSDVIFNPDWIGYDGRTKLATVSGSNSGAPPNFNRQILNLLPPTSTPDKPKSTNMSQEQENSAFTILPNTDLDGEQITRIPANNMMKCRDLCSINAKCESFTFDKWNGVCFLKNQTRNTFVQAKTISGRRSNLPPTVASTSPIQFSRYHNKSFYDKPYKQGSSRTFDECQRVCRFDNICIALSYKESSETCFLFDNVNAYQDGFGIESAAKRQ